jgi:hypothetical protein
MVEKRTYKFNWKIFIVGMAAITLGYILLMTRDITVAPILLVLGYCVLIPVSFL